MPARPARSSSLHRFCPSSTRSGASRRLLGVALSLGIVACFAAPAAHSQTDAYSIEVAISDRGDEQKREAFTLAMRQVLLANSGDKTLLNRSDVRSGVRDAEAFVEQFRFRVPKPGTVIDRNTPVTDRVRQSGEATQLMLVRFDRERITALIEGDEVEATTEAQQASAAATDSTSALVWMLIEDGPRDILVTGENVVNVQRRAIEIAGGAGFSLRFPAGDELDADAIGVEDLRILPALSDDDPRGRGSEADAFGRESPSAGDAAESATGTGLTDESVSVAQRLQRASRRYAETQILIGHVQRQPLRGWESAWQLIELESGRDRASEDQDAVTTEQAAEVVEPIRETRFTTDSLDSALQSGLGWLIPALDGGAEPVDDDRFADQRSATEALIWVGSLDDTKSYAQTQNFLAGIPGVTTVYPKLASADGMIFSISPRNALSNLNAALPGVDWLRPVARPQVASRSRLGRNTELTLDYIGPAGN